MRTKMAWVAGVIVVALGLTFAGTSLAQTTTTAGTRNFEVVAVDGNKLIVRDEKGTQEITVPDDFRFTVDGKKMAVSDLKPGMKGTATITTTTTIKQVAVTEIREGVVLSAGPYSMIVRDADGVRKKFTQEQLDQRGVQILKDGRAVRMDELKSGDVLTATIITQVAPVVVTEQEVQATLAKSKAEPAPTKAPTTMAAAPAATPPAAPAATPPATPPPAPEPSAAPPAPPPAAPAAPAGLGPMWWLLIAVIVAIVLFMVMRGKKKA